MPIGAPPRRGRRVLDTNGNGDADRRCCSKDGQITVRRALDNETNEVIPPTAAGAGESGMLETCLRPLPVSIDHRAFRRR